MLQPCFKCEQTLDYTMHLACSCENNIETVTRQTLTVKDNSNNWDERLSSTWKLIESAFYTVNLQIFGAVLISVI